MPNKKRALMKLMEKNRGMLGFYTGVLAVFVGVSLINFVSAPDGDWAPVQIGFFSERVTTSFGEPISVGANIYNLDEFEYMSIYGELYADYTFVVDNEQYDTVFIDPISSFNVQVMQDNFTERFGGWRWRGSLTLDFEDIERPEYFENVDTAILKISAVPRRHTDDGVPTGYPSDEVYLSVELWGAN